MKSRKSCVKHAKVAVRVALLSGFAALTVQIPLASAADYGVGVLFSGQGSTVLAPVRLESLTVEPELSFFRTSSNQETFHVVTLSTGIYVRKDLGQSFESYVGGRIGYSRSKDRFDFGTGTQNAASHAWMLSPTFGVQHFFAKRFSIGLDVGLQYARFSQKTNLSDFPTLNSSANGYSSGTLTRILLRTYF